MSVPNELSTATLDTLVANPQTKSDESHLVFRDASENFPYKLKGEASILDLLHTIDWAETSLGHAKHWPKILLNTVRLMLVSRYAMCCWWGPENRMVSKLHSRTEKY
jgi:hypothetical protein